jgi:hypothetical protein
VLYDGGEPLDVAGTIGVVSTPARVLPAIEAVTIAHAVGPVALAGGPTVVARHGSADAPPAGERRSRMSSVAIECFSKGEPLVRPPLRQV